MPAKQAHISHKRGDRVPLGDKYEGGTLLDRGTHLTDVAHWNLDAREPAVYIDTGFYATLPTLMGVLAVRYGKTYKWHGIQAAV